MASYNLEELKRNLAEFKRRFAAAPEDWGRKLAPEEVQWLLDHCPYLQIVASGGAEPADKVKTIVATSSNWNIIDYGDALGSSPGQYIFGGGYFRVRYGDDDEDDEGGGGVVNPGKGTIINQAFVTAREMVQIAIKRGWYGIHLVDYHRLMGRAAWIEAEQSEVAVTGFEPERKDKRIQQLVTMSKDQIFDYGLRSR